MNTPDAPNFNTSGPPRRRLSHRIANKWKHVRNKRMAVKLTRGEALSVLEIGEALGDGHYKLNRFVEEMDYYDPEAEAHIWSIGRNKATGEIIASVTGEFYLNKEYDCLWLR